MIRFTDRIRPFLVFVGDAALLLGAYWLALGLRFDFGKVDPSYGWSAAAQAGLVVVAMQLAFLKFGGARRRLRNRFRLADAARMFSMLFLTSVALMALRVGFPQCYWLRPPYTVAMIDCGVAFVFLTVVRILYAAWLESRREAPLFRGGESAADATAHRAFLAGRTVMVTGAGGTIGSELARQAVAAGARRVILVERGENALYEVERRLRTQGEVIAQMTDIADVARMEKVFSEYRPEIVLHAAAYKHVPMVEVNPKEGIANNFLATIDLARMAERHGVSKFVFISTDKAVRPVSAMGATKRLCEMALGSMKGGTSFVGVRFGNVIGSSGSVIPLFEEQVASGGPVTITDERMTRYFMSVEEAVSLVLTAAELPDASGRIYVLDMGKPHRIVDVAERIIRRSGARPVLDVPVEFTGMRPGERLEEDLGVKGQGMVRTGHSKIFVCEDPKSSPDRIAEIEARCRALVTGGETAAEAIAALLEMAR